LADKGYDPRCLIIPGEWDELLPSKGKTLMRKLFVFVAVLGLVAASCGGGSADSCEGVVDEAMDAIQAMIDGFDDLTLEDAMSMEDDPAFVTENTAKLDSLEQKAEDLGCSEDELTALFEDKAGNLKADSELGQMMIDEMEASGFN